MTMFKLTLRNWRWSWHVYACCVAAIYKAFTKTLFERD